MWSALKLPLMPTGRTSRHGIYGLRQLLTVINPTKPFLQSLEVQFALSRGVQPGPETLDSRIAFILRLPKTSLHVGDEFGDTHVGSIGDASSVVRAAASLAKMDTVARA